MTRELFLLLILALAASCHSHADDAAAIGNSVDGRWQATTAELGGMPFPDEVRRSITLTVEGGRYTVMVGTQADKGTVAIDASKTPKALDITGTEGPNQGKTILAIFERTGDSLKVCYDLTGKARPTEFKTEKGTQLFLVTYGRKQP